MSQVGSSLELLQRSIDGLSCTIDHQMQFMADIKTACTAVLDDLDDRYDGCPDSRTLWMGEHITRLRALLNR